MDVAVAQIECGGPVKMQLPGYRVRTKGHQRQYRHAAEALNQAERPVLYVGGGVIVAQASEEIENTG